MSWWGNFMNSVTGTSTSAKQQFGHQMALQQDAQNFAKWQMANAHQQEVQDLQKAGLNPVLSAGGSGASAGVTEGGAQSGAPMVNPIDILFTAINTAKSLEKTDAEIQTLNSEREKNLGETAKALAEAGLTKEQINYYMKHGVFPGAVTTRTSSGGTFLYNGSSSETIPVGLKSDTYKTTGTTSAKQQRQKREKTDRLLEKHEKEKKEMGGWFY